jgi:arylsulfatase A-like enzyme
MLAALEARGLTDRTLIVVTADHGGQRDEAYLGNNGTQTCCALENAPVETSPYWIAHMNALAPGALRTSYAATSVTFWLADHSPAVEARLTLGLKDFSGITEIYALRRTGNTYRYEQVFSALAKQPAKFRAWAQRHSAELMATMAGPAAPDLVGLLADGFGFGRIGDHGGAQEAVQRIPMIIHVPGEAGSKRSTPLRLMDVAPEITKILGLKPAPGLSD